jgi:Tfp pilus assembly protein PilN
MIKINLSASKRTASLSNVGGVDLTKIKIVFVMLAVVFMYLPDYFLLPLWEEEFNNKTTELTTLNGQLRKLQAKVTQSQNLEKQINELRAQEENLSKKLTAVKQAISEKKNPTSLLLYIAKNIPEDLWILELAINGDSMTIKGEAEAYASIGSFVTSLRSSVFISDANIIGTSTKASEGNKRRLETFEVRFTIARFEQ